jgi:hypothetical protein
MRPKAEEHEMGVEFYIRFKTPGWRSENKARIQKFIEGLQTFVYGADGSYEFQGLEGRDEPKRWGFDVRLFAESDGSFLMEESARPASIERDVSALLAWLREETVISVEDEDGASVGW